MLQAGTKEPSLRPAAGLHLGTLNHLGTLDHPGTLNHLGSYIIFTLTVIAVYQLSPCAVGISK